MAKDIDMLLSAGVGYLIGQGPYQEWKPFIDNVGTRVGHLKYMKITVPAGLFEKLPALKQTYHEAVNAFIYGLPNAALPVLFKCLELGLRRKYEETEDKSAGNLRSHELIEWGEKFMQKQNKPLAHWVRYIRNYLHESELVKEQEAYQAIANVSTILNELFPYEQADVGWACQRCKQHKTLTLPAKDNVLGHVITVNCDTCKTAINLRILV